MTVVSAGPGEVGPLSNSSGPNRLTVRGTTGPATGRSIAPPGLAVGVWGAGSTGIGSATGMPLVPMMRSISRST